MNLDSVAQLLELDPATPLTIVTVGELPALSTIGGKARWTNRFIALDQRAAAADGVTILRARSGQVWCRIRDVP